MEFVELTEAHDSADVHDACDEAHEACDAASRCFGNCLPTPSSPRLARASLVTVVDDPEGASLIVWRDVLT